MLKFTSILLLFFSIIFITSCSTKNKIATLKPEPDDAIPLTYINTPSYINLPVSIKLKDIENQTNTLLNGFVSPFKEGSVQVFVSVAVGRQEVNKPINNAVNNNLIFIIVVFLLVNIK